MSSPDISNSFTQATNLFIQTFSGYTHQLMSWGTWLFISLAGINLGWLALGYAFEKDLPASMIDFIKRFFIMMFFYTVMMNPNWLLDMASSFTQMGQTLTGIPLDPSAVIENGIMISDRISQSVETTSILHDFFGAFVVAAINMGVIFTFFSIGVRLAYTLIINTALVVVSAFFLGFGGLQATNDIARACITTILANCARLLGIYLVIGSGSQVVNTISANIPTTFSGSFDTYLILAAISYLLFELARKLPEQFARIVSHALNDTSGVDVLATGSNAVRTAQTATPGVKAAASGAAAIARTAGSIGTSAASQFMANSSQGMGTATLKAAAGVAGTVAKHAIGTMSDHIKQAATKLAGGGNPLDGSTPPVTPFTARMYQSSQATHKSTQAASEKGKS